MEASNMGQEYKKTLPMIIACLSIVLSIALPLAYVATSLEGKDPLQSRYYSKLMIYAVACLFLWTIPSALLIKGIKENRPKLMAPWLYLNYLSLAVLIFAMIIVFHGMLVWTGSAWIGLLKCLPFVIIWLTSLLFTILVRKLYIQFLQSTPATPVPVESACAGEVKKPQDDKGYMPIFENH